MMCGLDSLILKGCDRIESLVIRKRLNGLRIIFLISRE